MDVDYVYLLLFFVRGNAIATYDKIRLTRVQF